MKACEDKNVEAAMNIIKENKLKLDSVDASGETALMYSIKNKLKDIALEILKTGKSNPEHADKDGRTALIYAIIYNLSEVAIEIIKTGKSNSEKADKHGITALIYAISWKLPEVVTEIIKTGKSNPEQADIIRGKTALIYAIRNKSSEVAIEIIKTGKSNPQQVDKEEKTALIYAIQSNLQNIATEIIKTGKSNPEQVDKDGRTALIYAIQNKLQDVAMEIIKTGKSNSEQADKRGMTALMYAIQKNLQDVAMEIIKTGKSNPEQVDEDGRTALMDTILYDLDDSLLLSREIIKTGNSKPEQVDIKRGRTSLIYAITHKLPEIAIEIIKTGKSNPEHIDNQGKSALMYAEERKYKQIIDTLKSLKEKITFNINNDCYDFMNIENVPIIDFLKEDNNIVFVFFDKNIGNSVRIGISIDLFKDKVNNKDDYIVYECKVPDTMKPENILKNTPYFDIKKLCGFGDVIPLENITAILNAIENGLSSNIFIFKRDRELVSTVSDDVLNHRTNYVSARHCQTGQNSFVYKLLKDIIFSCNIKKRKTKSKLIILEDSDSKEKTVDKVSDAVRVNIDENANVGGFLTRKKITKNKKTRKNYRK